MAGVNNEYLSDHKLFRLRNKKITALFPIIAVLVAIIVFWCLKLIGITITSDALCGVEEHIHGDECYSFVEDSTDMTGELAEKVLICNKPEHTHSSECFPDKSADTETASDWVKTIENVEITNDVAKNLLGIASSQVGYTESTLNYEYDKNAEKNGYTRYGEWYGNPYGKWNTLFASFCINYANINNSDLLISASAEGMRLAWQEKRVYSSASEYSPCPGDLAFFETDSDGKADRVGVVVFLSDGKLLVIEGDADGAVEKVTYDNTDTVIGYGMTGELYAAQHITDEITEQSDEETELSTDISGELNFYIPDGETATADDKVQNVFNADPLMMMSAESKNIITYTSHLEDEVVNAVFKEQSGAVIGDGGTVYIGQTYIISLQFGEINTGNEWIQFEHNEDGYLTYHVPENLHCEPFDSWHTISATTEIGTVEDVGEYFIDENGLLRVRFYDDANGENFVDKYSNVNFTIDFNATVASTQSGSTTDVVFNDKINIELNVDGGADAVTTKTHGEYNATDNTLEYTIRVEATHGVVKNLIIDDEIWNTHYTLTDTIVVTDLDGNLIVPQPEIGVPAINSQGAVGGFRLSGFPDFSAGNGFLITYKTAVYDYLFSNESVDLWNGVTSMGNDSNGTPVDITYTSDWLKVELEKLVKDGKQADVTDANGDKIPVVEWQIGIRKTDSNLQGTVVVDTLGDGLAYYTGTPIKVTRYDEWGYKVSDSYISWNDVTINGNTMEFALPDGHAFDIVYYTTFENLDDGETKTYTNSAKVTINGKEEQAQGSADVVGFIPFVEKSAKGDDGEYVYFTIKANVPGVIKDWGNFYLTDLAAFWGHDDKPGESLYVENIPENLVITATIESGKTVTFTPYRQGGTVENTYLLIAPVIAPEGELQHSFNILFNTADTDLSTSKWILDEDSELTITYKMPFDAKTGTNWEGELNGDRTLGDVLLSNNTLSNEVYLNYTNTITEVASTIYKYSPIITKKSVTHEDGTIDYTVTFNNTIPGSYGNDGYINANAAQAWFNDTFDERMEYVQDSLIVTCYPPWEETLWTMKYKYSGAVTGNTIYVSAGDMKFYDYNEDASDWEYMKGTQNLNDYYHWLGAGGKYVFTYSLKLKDEYLFTTEHAKIELDNTAELTWGADGSSGPVTDTAEFTTGLVDKVAVQDNTKINFDIHINVNALDILPSSDTLTIEDTMTANLSVYWRTIKLFYEDGEDNWVDFDSSESSYTYTVTYDQANNRLTFVVPDELHIRIDYTTLITEAGLVSINNSVSINGKVEVSDIVDALFRVEQHSGGASGSTHEIMLLKQDGISKEPLPDASFILYGPMGIPNPNLPAGVSGTIITEDGTVLSYIGTYTTGEAGTVLIDTQYLTMGGPYALVEKTAPAGYSRLDDPVYFYFYDTDPNSAVQTVTTLIAVENYNGGFLIPETGGFGVLPTAIIGAALIAYPVLYSSIRRKRERRLN